MSALADNQQVKQRQKDQLENGSLWKMKSPGISFGEIRIVRTVD
jgi:hypothetical protein